MAFGESHTAIVAIAIHDSTYLLDFSVKNIELKNEQETAEDTIADHIIQELQSYEHQNLSKFVGAGIPYELLKKSPKLCSRLWLDLDIVPILIHPELDILDSEPKDGATYWDVKCIDEQADSMARKCIM